jgi:selT/selW/selH-like putative selenoprotein
MSYDEYKAQMTRNQERFLEVESSVELSDADVAFFKNLPSPLNVVVLAEDWCGDVVANLPVLYRLAEASGKLNLSIFLRDQNLDITDQYLNAGQFRSIPVFVFFDENFREVGHWIERPAKMTELTQQYRREIFATDPELSGYAPTTSPSELPEETRLHLGQRLTAFRAEKRHFSDSEVVREIRELLAGKTQAKSSVIPVTVNTPSWKMSTQPPSEQPVKVSITYCAECGYEPQTLELASALMVAFRGDLAAIEIIPWHDGMFDVVVDGELVHSMLRDGGFPENETVLRAVRNRLGVLETN